MKFFKRNKDGFVDLTEYHKKQEARIQEIRGDLNSQNVSSEEKVEEKPNNAFGFFPGFGVQKEEPKEPERMQTSTELLSAHEKRRKLAQRLKNITDRLEEISNQIYHLQQRVEVLEKKDRMEY